MGNLPIDQMQRRIVTLGVMADPEWVSPLLVEKCSSEKDAVILCWNKRNRKGLTLRQAAEEMSIQPSHLSNIVAGKKYLPHDFRIKFQQLCGNWAIRQYEDWACGLFTQKETPEQRELRLLRAENEQLKKRA